MHLNILNNIKKSRDKKPIDSMERTNQIRTIKKARDPQKAPSFF